METLTQTDLIFAIEALDLPILAAHVAGSALASARENGAAGEVAYSDAADRLDDYRQAAEVCGCGLLVALSDRDLRLVARLAVAKLEGRA